MAIYQGDTATDDRGTLSFVNDFDFNKVKRFYVVENHRSWTVRGWHGHRNEEKFVYVIQGRAQFLVKDMDTGEVEKVVLSDRKPQILHIPANKFNAFQTETNDTKVIFYSTSTLEESQADDIREKFTPDDSNLLWSKTR